MKTYYSNINNFKDSTQDMADAPFESRYASYLDRISEKRKEHLLRFKHEDDRLRSLAGTILLTDVIRNLQKNKVDCCCNLSNDESALNIESEESLSRITFPLDIESEDSGKPYITDAPNIRFSISHSGEYAAVCVAHASECKRIGIDIQAMDRSNISKIAKRFYTDLEKSIIANAESDEAKEELFYRIWSAKEAFIKCDGKGLAYGIENFNADIINELITDLAGKNLATIKKQPCPKGYACYICIQ